MPLPEIEWKPISRIAFFGWMGFYVLHLLFGWFGATLGLWGGTILQLLVPALLVVAFVVRGDLLGTTFCAVAFFHSLTGVATYMIDALRRQLPLVTVGAPADEAEHDWVHIFSDLGVLPHAIQIGTATRVIAWLRLLGTLAWFSWRSYR